MLGHLRPRVLSRPTSPPFQLPIGGTHDHHDSQPQPHEEEHRDHGHDPLGAVSRLASVVSDFPTRESEAREWIEAAIMLLTKDGLDVVLVIVPSGCVSTYFRVIEPQRVIGDLDGLKWNAELTFNIEKGCEIVGFEARTPEEFLVAQGSLHREKFPTAGTYTFMIGLDFNNFPLTTER